MSAYLEAGQEELLRNPDWGPIKEVGSVCGRTCAGVLPLLTSNEQVEQFVASVVLFTIGDRRLPFNLPAVPDILGRLYSLAVQSPSKSVRDGAAAAFLAMPLKPRGPEQPLSTIDRAQFATFIQPLLIERFPLFHGGARVRETHGDSLDSLDRQVVLLIVAWYLRAASDAEIGILAFEIKERVERGSIARRALDDLLEGIR